MIEKKLTLSKKKIHTELKCPYCNVGSLLLNKENLMSKQYQSNINEIHELMEEVSCGYCPIPQKFIAVGIFTCTHEACQEHVSFRGERLVQEDMRCNPKSEEEEIQEFETLTIETLYPMVHLIPVHEEYPIEVREVLIESFNLYLEYPSSCANKLRVLVEKILDNLKIPSKSKKGNRLTTHQRVIFLKKTEHKEADYLMSLKWVGNQASHDTVIKQDDLPKIYENVTKKGQ